MAEPVKVQLGTVQQTLFIPLAGRARESGRKDPLLRLLRPLVGDVAAVTLFQARPK